MEEIKQNSICTSYQSRSSLADEETPECELCILGGCSTVQPLPGCCLKFVACWSKTWTMRGKAGRQRGKASFPHYSLPAKHGRSHHTRCFISLADFNCEDPAASVDFRLFYNPPASLALQCFHHSIKVLVFPPSSLAQVAQTRVLQCGGLKVEVLDCPYLGSVSMCVWILCVPLGTFLSNLSGETRVVHVMSEHTRSVAPRLSCRQLRLMFGTKQEP